MVSICESTTCGTFAVHSHTEEGGIVMVRLCPECAAGKTVNCTGEAYDPEGDEFVICDTLVRAQLDG